MNHATRFGLVAAAALAAAGPASADIFLYSLDMLGVNESPPNASPGFGSGTVTWDTTAFTMTVDVSFSGLFGSTTAAHIHGPTAAAGTGTAGVATTTPSFVGFPLGVTAGVHQQVYDMSLSSSYNPSFITNNGGTPTSAGLALKAAFDAGKAYYNIHTSAFGGGEIRGFLTLVPAPGATTLAGLVGLAALRRRR